MNYFAILLGKLLIQFFNISNLGSGSTWPGHLALKLNKNFTQEILKHSKIKIIIVAGTNGKTTTARLITSIIRENNKTYLQNKAGANLVNGLASTIIRGTSLKGKLNKDYLIFESDENALPNIINQTNPDYIVALDLFRDQLDRYGEIEIIAQKWHNSFKKLSEKTTLVLNADDAQIAYLAKDTKAKAIFFGLEKSKEDKEIRHGADSIHCPSCSERLNFSTVFYSHLGIWNCQKCDLRRPELHLSNIPNYPLVGNYNKYNALAASLLGLQENISIETSQNAFASFTPAFGRQEKLEYKGVKTQIFLAKNPTSFNESLEAIKELGGKNLLILLNDRIPDGIDVSWIWDINFEDILTKDMNIGISGDRVYDMSLRLKYAEIFAHHHDNPETMLTIMIETLEPDETLYILPNYSAMLDIRKILTGKKIL